MVNFRTRSKSISADRVPYAFNSLLPPDIRVIGCERRLWSFTPDSTPLAKQYIYRIENRRISVPASDHYSHFIGVPLDVAAMREAEPIGRSAGFSRRSRVRATPLAPRYAH